MGTDAGEFSAMTSGRVTALGVRPRTGSATVGLLSLLVAATAASVSATLVLASPLFTAVDVSVSTKADLSSFVGETFAITDVVLTAGLSAVGFLVSVALDVSVALAESGAKPCIAPSDKTNATPQITGLTSSEYHKVLDMS
jgi:hypothetical protein